MSDKGGSDLDVFDGLAKKSQRPSVPDQRAPAPPPPLAKKTLLGLPAPNVPLPPPSRAGAAPPPPPSRVSVPPPPPSRVSAPPPLAAAPPPPSRRSAPPPPAPPSRAPAPPPPAQAAPVDMDWDDEDEKTAVFDKATEDASRALLRSAPPPAPPPASGRALGAGALMSSSGGAAPIMPPTPAPPPLSMPAPVSAQPAPQSMPMPLPASSMPAQQAGSSKNVVLAVVAVLLLGTIAGIIVLLLPREGTLVVTAAGPGNKSLDGVQVFIDGQKRCDSSPCRVEKVGPGTHMVRVDAAGYQKMSEQAAAVRAGEDTVVNLKLDRASGGTGVKVSAEGAGLKLYVDGKEVGPLPQEIKDMAPGEHTLRVAGNDRFEPYEKKITVTADEVQTLPLIKLKVVKGLAMLKAGAGADGAKITLVSGDERRPVPKLPMNLDIPTNKSWQVVAERKGYQAFKADITFEDGTPERTFEIVLYENGKAPPKEEAATPPVGAPAGTGAPATTAKPAATGNGTLNINSIPVSNVILDGKPLGTTPKVGLSVAAGPHTVVFVHPEHGRKARSVNVEAGKSATAAVRFP